MKRRHVVVFRVFGIAGSNTDITIPLPAGGYECVLTQNADPWLEASDRASAIGSLMLRAMFMREDGTLKATPEERVEAEAARIREERAGTMKSSHFLVLHRTDEATIELPKTTRETDRYVVCFDAIDKAALRRDQRPEVAHAIMSLALAFPRILGLDQVRDAVDLHRDDGKQVVSLSFEMRGNLTITTGVAPGDLADAASVADAVRAADRMTRVELQLMDALSTHTDRLRGFLSAFFALECFVNQAFKLYEAKLYDAMRPTGKSTVHLLLDRIRGKMHEHYTLADRFALVAGQLDPNSSEGDFEEFKKAKKHRDRFSHGESIDEAALPISEVLRILRKYLALHLGLKPE